MGLIFANICEIHENWSTSANFPPRIYDETYLFFNIYETSKGQAIIQDFAAHCAMKNEQMAQGRKFKSKSEPERKFNALHLKNHLTNCGKIRPQKLAF